jgi:hypothetical protein
MSRWDKAVRPRLAGRRDCEYLPAVPRVRSARVSRAGAIANACPRDAEAPLRPSLRDEECAHFAQYLLVMTSLAVFHYQKT